MLVMADVHSLAGATAAFSEMLDGRPAAVPMSTEDLASLENALSLPQNG